MDTTERARLLEQITSIEESIGKPAERESHFPSLRSVDGPISQLKYALQNGGAPFEELLQDFLQHEDLGANSRRVRLERVIVTCKTAKQLLRHTASKKTLKRAPDLTAVLYNEPDLVPLITSRWYEAQKCQLAGAYLAAVVMMGSILEALLLARVLQNQSDACRATAAPKDREGKVKAVWDWSLPALIDVAVELGWLRSDRGAFSHALRMSRNIVHPWQQRAERAEFDASTCRTCWEVILGATEDLRVSVR